MTVSRVASTAFDASLSARTLPGEPAEPRVSILIPVLNDAELLGRLLARLEQTAHSGVEVLVIDGGSHDGSRDAALQHRCTLVEGAHGRGAQLALGASRARGRFLWMLH